MVQELAVLVQETVHIGEPAGAPNTEDTEFKERNIYMPPDAQDMITALAGISKTPYWVKTEEIYLDAAQCLIGHSASPAQVEGFPAWWEANGFYAGKPALKSILDNWANYRAGISTPKPSTNGHHKKQPAPDTGLKQIAPGVY